MFPPIQFVLSLLFPPQVFNESISSVAGGTVGHSTYEEVTVATHNGRIFGLTREPMAPKPMSQEVKAKLDAMK